MGLLSGVSSKRELLHIPLTLQLSVNPRPPRRHALMVGLANRVGRCEGRSGFGGNGSVQGSVMSGSKHQGFSEHERGFFAWPGADELIIPGSPNLPCDSSARQCVNVVTYSCDRCHAVYIDGPEYPSFRQNPLAL